MAYRDHLLPLDYGRIGRARSVNSNAGILIAALIAPLLVLLFYSNSLCQCNYVPGDVNNDGRPGMADVNYLVNYFKGLGPAPPVSCDCPPHGLLYPAADANGSCMVTASDVTMIINYLKGNAGSISYCADCPPSEYESGSDYPNPIALDIGMPDTIRVGNLDGTPIYAPPGSIAEIPVWVKNDESVPSMSVSLATDNIYVSQRLGGDLSFPLTSWDDCSFLPPVADQPAYGYTSQSITGWNDLGGASNPYMNSHGDYALIGAFSIMIDPDLSHLGDTTMLVLGNQPRIGGAVLVDSMAGSEWEVQPVFSLIVIHEPLCSYVPGDINGNGSANGLDVTFGVAYFRGDTITIPPDSCFNCPDNNDTLLAAGDVNGSCSFNGIDITYFVAYLKSMNPALLFCQDCAPTDLALSSAPDVMPTKSPDTKIKSRMNRLE